MPKPQNANIPSTSVVERRPSSHESNDTSVSTAPALVAEGEAVAPVPVPVPARKTVEDWAAAKATSLPLMAGARVMHGWARGRVLAEADFDKGIHQVNTLSIGSAESTRKKES